MKQATAWFVLALILAYGCVEPPQGGLVPAPPGQGGSAGEGGGPPDDYFTAKELFDLNVYPIFDSKCTPCHTQGANAAPIWLGAEESSSYAKIEGYPKPLIAHPDNSLLRLKGEHTGPALAIEDDFLVAEWLMKEVDERGLFGDPTFEPDPGAGGAGGEGGEGGAGGEGGGPVNDTTLLQALEAFGACMQWKDWESTGMVDLPNQLTAAGACKSCHFAGMGGNWLSGDPVETFEKNRLFPYVLKIAVGTVNEVGAFSDLVPARRHIDKGIESQMCDAEPCHPAFLLSPEMETAVENFFLLSYARWKQGLCEP